MRAAITLTLFLAMCDCGLAQTGPVIAVPGRPGVPVIINGRDASYAVVEGDWGLAKGVHVQPTIFGAWERSYRKNVGRYFPGSSTLPGYGRLEQEPPDDRPQPPEPQTFYRSWSAESAGPMEQQIPQQPPIIVAPEIGGQGTPYRRRP